MFLTVTLAFVIVGLTIIYLKGKYNEYYWKKRGVIFYDKHKTGGPLWEFATENRSFFQILNDIYWEYEKAPAVGLGSIFEGQGLYVKDPINIQHVTQGDFHAFNHRGVAILEEDILANNVLFMNGPKWKLIRQKLTPIFTTAKLRNMYYIVDKSAQDFVEYLKQNPEKQKGDCFDTLSHFCSAAIAAAVFGIGAKSTFDSPFREMVRRALIPNFRTNLRFAISGVSDFVFRTFKLKLFTEHEDFFIGAMKQVIRQREKEDVKRHDFVDMCVKLQGNGTMEDPDTGLKLEPTDEVLAAQAFFFFIAGVEPTAAGMFGALMEMGRHPEVLKRVHEDIDELFDKYDGKLTYDAISELKYLDNILSESLRLHPPIGFLTRQCIKDSVLPVGKIPVDKGVKIFTPIFEMHHDRQYFPDPEKFDPERFEREGEVNDLTYMPFGKGNRICIGARYARIQIITGIVHLLRHYTLQTHVNKGGIKYNKEQAQVRLKNVNVEFIPREQSK